MARVSDNVLTYNSQLGMYLDRYAEIMELDGDAFNGINKPTTYHDNECIDIVSQTQRDRLAKFLLQAEQKRENWLGYFLSPKWTIMERCAVGHDNPFTLEHKHLIAIGYPATIAIEEGVLLDHGVPPFSPDNPPTDPVIINIATDVTVDEIIVTYPDEDVQIHPARISASGGVVTLRIPRCRLVKPEYNEDWDDPPSYYDNDVFLETVDVKRLYADVSRGAEFVWIYTTCATDCEPRCQTACPTIEGAMAYELSIVHLRPATYADGGWTTRGWALCNLPDSVRISYLSGRKHMSDEIYTIRLAHTLMPRPPCACDLVKQRWTEDREVLDRTFTAYGSMRGAVEAWMNDSLERIGHGGMFPGVR